MIGAVPGEKAPDTRPQDLVLRSTLWTERTAHACYGRAVPQFHRLPNRLIEQVDGRRLATRLLLRCSDGQIGLRTVLVFMIARYRFVLTNRPYLFLLSSRSSQRLAISRRLALTWLMYTLTGSVLASAAVLVVSAVPAALIGPLLAAATASRSHRRATIPAMSPVPAFLPLSPSVRPLCLPWVWQVSPGSCRWFFESRRSAWLPHVTGTIRSARRCRWPTRLGCHRHHRICRRRILLGAGGPEPCG